MKLRLGIALFVLGGPGSANALDEDFERPAFNGWIATGKAFGDGPRNGRASSRAEGTGAGLLGTLRSEVFRIGAPYLQFRIAGGDHAFRTSLHLWIEDRIVRTSTGGGSDDLIWRCWDVSEFVGRDAWIEMVDAVGVSLDQGFIEVDEIRAAHAPRGGVEGEVLLALQLVRMQAREAVMAALPRARSDPDRPVYHFRPPAQRMNDPNGPFFANGYYHLFYQFNPFADRGADGCMMWAHARSRDLVHWEHLPIALWPEWEKGELQCFSGSAFRSPAGEPWLFYTHVPARGAPRSQMIAVPDDAEYRKWRRHPANPVLGFETHNGPAMDPYWRDPFVFDVDGRIFMTLVSKHLPLFESLDSTLTRWTYRGRLYDRPGLDTECPNFFRFGDRWLLLHSPKGAPEYVTGSFNPATATFTQEREGPLNHTNQYYATHGLQDDRGRVILFGLIKGFPMARSWTGALAIPRVLTLDSEGIPRMHPIPELQVLRGTHVRLNDLMTESRLPLEGVLGDSIEIIAEIESGEAKAFGLRVRASVDGTKGVELRYADGRLHLPRASVAMPLRDGRLRLHVFLDKGALEVFADEGRVAEVRVIQSSPGDLGVEFFAEGGFARLVSLDAWTLSAAGDDEFPWDESVTIPAGTNLSASP